MTVSNKINEKATRKNRLAFSFAAVSISVFLTTWTLHLPLFDFDIPITYFPHFAGPSAFLVWLFSISWVIRIIPLDSWFYKSWNPLWMSILHGNIFMLLLVFTNGLAAERNLSFFVVSSNLGGLYTGICFMLFPKWKNLENWFRKTSANRYSVVLIPLLIVALYYKVFPTVFPESAFRLMPQNIQAEIIEDAFDKLKIGDPINAVFDFYPQPPTSYETKDEYALYPLEGRDRRYFITKNDSLHSIYDNLVEAKTAISDLP